MATDAGDEVRMRMLWPAVALVVTQVVHAAVPVDADHVDSEGPLGLIVGLLFLGLSVAAMVGLIQRRPYGRPLAAWTGLAVALGFIAYHATPWASWFTNPYLGKPVGAPAWISVGLAVGAAFWCAYEGRDVIRGRVAGGGAATA
jgi:hypothetical protein